MAPSFTPEDERLLVTIRTAIWKHGRGTWEDTTAIYNRLVPSRVQQALPSLMARYRITKQRQIEHVSEHTEDARLRAEIERLLAEANETSTTTVQPSYLPPTTLHTPAPSRALAPVATWEEHAETGALDCEEVEHEPLAHEGCSPSLHPTQPWGPPSEATRAVSSNADASRGPNEFAHSSSMVDPKGSPSSLAVDTTAGFLNMPTSPYHLPTSHFSPDTASSSSSSSSRSGSGMVVQDIDSEAGVAQHQSWDTKSLEDLPRRQWDMMHEQALLGGLDYFLPSNWRYSI